MITTALFKRSVWALIICICSNSFVSAQVKSTEFEGSYIPNSKVLPIAKGKMAFVCSDWEGIYISTYDSTSALVWEKDYVVPKKRTRLDWFTASADGKDIWALSKGDEITVTWVDAITGDTKSKSLEDEEFGIIYSIWANSKYFFVMTTSAQIWDSDFAKNPEMKLHRFSKENLERVKLDHDMDKPTQYGNVLWEIIRVEENFFEGFVVTSAGKAIGIKLRRFDNNGKEISTKEEDFMIKEADHVTRQVHGYSTPGPGIAESNHSYQMYSVTNGVAIELIYPMASVQLAYEPKSGAYYCYGIIGPGEQKRIGTVYDGFFLAKLTKDFVLDKYKEFIDLPVFESDRNFEIHAGADGHYIQCYFDVQGNPIVQMGSENMYYMTIDASDLALTKAMEVEGRPFYFSGNVITLGTNSLGTDPAAEAYQGKFYSFAVLVSGNWQYGFSQNYNKGDVAVLTKPAK